MNRRGSFAALIALAGGMPSARAQSAPSAQRRTLGILSLGSARDDERIEPAARAELSARGWIEGRNLLVETAFAGNHPQRLPALADGLLRRRVDVIWAFAEGAAIAAARATRSIPIVFVWVPWPVETGLVDSFARPGRNVTGVSSYAGIDVSTKRLEFLKEIAPEVTRLFWILDAAMVARVDGGTFEIRPLLDSAATLLGYQVRYREVRTTEDLDAAFADILDWRAQAIAVAGGAVTSAARRRIVEFALRHRLPTSCSAADLVAEGGLYSYNSAGALTEQIARAVEYVDRVLRGARPADLPVVRPDRYELVVNLKTANALGLQIPRSVLLRTDRVIE